MWFPYLVLIGVGSCCIESALCAALGSRHITGVKLPKLGFPEERSPAVACRRLPSSAFLVVETNADGLRIVFFVRCNYVAADHGFACLLRFVSVVCLDGRKLRFLSRMKSN